MGTMNQSELERRVVRHNWFHGIRAVGLAVGALLAWNITIALTVWLVLMLQDLVEFFEPHSPLAAWMPTILTPLLLLVVVVVGFTRDENFLELSGWAKSSANLGNSGKTPLSTNAMNRYSGQGYFLVEILLLAPAMTREAIGATQSMLRVTPDTTAAAAHILHELRQRRDWVPRGRYHHCLDGVELLHRLDMIWQDERHGITLIRAPIGQ
jgi:hypothetical protein